MLKLVLTLTLMASMAQAKMTAKDHNLLQIATSSLEANIERFEEGSFLTAGRHQFRSLWTRDFCWASRGLLLSDNEDVVRDHISGLLNRMREDGLVPKVLDSMKPPKRVLNTFISKLFPWIPKVSPITGNLKPYFIDESKSVAIDSNMMVLLTTIAYMKKTDDQQWFKEHLDRLVRVYNYYDSKMRGELIYQEAFSDWQDSVKREGFTFLSNLIYYIVSRDLASIEEFNIDKNWLEKYKQKIITTFYHKESGLFKSMANHPYISLDGNLMALEHHFLAEEESQTLYDALKNSKFFEKTVGWNTYPRYPRRWKSLATKIAFLPYHDRAHWSWLMAFSAKVAYLYGDKQTGDRLYGQISKLLIRDGVVHEIYHYRHLRPWRSLPYDSEAPFSWGSGFVIDMLNTRTTCCN